MVDISTPPFLELLHIISGQDRYDYYTEMHHCRAIIHHANHLDRFVGPPRSNMIVQLGGSHVEDMATATKILQDQGYAEVNINNGCPSPNVQHGSFGAVLMKTPQTVADILTAMDKMGVTMPVTVKCRIGVDHQDTMEFLHDYVHTLLTKTSKPPPHLIVHARKCILKGLSPKQNRSIPPLNYERVYQLVETFPDLVVSINGGFNTVESIQKALDKVDGCMIGRKVMDEPLFLQQLDCALYDQTPKSVDQIVQDYLDYADRLYATKPNDDYHPPPPTLMIRPLMGLYKGRVGRNFRREIQHTLKADTPLHLFHAIVMRAIHESNSML
ncbi:dihydrouridine synthase-domain-containing protein [Gilbertella persicaria]|uniref:dihydrouridine synthase-domain-containing protein n=1 Tax=Gilbertella persicaria TaxID=101096 RepID=UPI00221EB096|nr:dihydrouridine synthase-domain-containing protein [Gilbertella persicaria]KAI8076381.1 dihydrouridine synthase-domain-containing protein [Gilbertella persicaria]